MNWYTIFSILRKDLLDATRDARVLMALVIPLGIAVFYNFTVDEETPTPSATVAYVAEEETELFDRLRSVAETSIEITFEEYESSDEIRERVADEDADVGFIIPDGFDRAIRAGESPQLDVIFPEEPGLDSEFVLSALTPVLREMAGQEPAAALQIDIVSPTESDLAIFEQLGLRTYFILAAMAMFIAFVAMLAMPVTLTEEVEKKTIEALVLISSYTEIIISKALLGIIYVVVGVPLLLWFTDQAPEEPATFGAVAMLISITLIGFGLFIGVLFKNANQLNTWSGIILIPVIAPAFMVGVPLPDAIDSALLVHPVGQAMRLLINSMGGEQLFGNVGLSWLVMVAWAVGGYALLGWQLSRQNA